MADSGAVAVEFNLAGAVDSSLPSSVAQVQAQLAQLRGGITSLGDASKGLNVRGLDKLSEQLGGVGKTAESVVPSIQALQSEMKGGIRGASSFARSFAGLDTAIKGFTSGDPVQGFRSLGRALQAGQVAVASFGAGLAVLGVGVLALNYYLKDQAEFQEEVGKSLETESQHAQAAAVVWHDFVDILAKASDGHVTLGRAIDGTIGKTDQLAARIKALPADRLLAALEDDIKGNHDPVTDKLNAGLATIEGRQSQLQQLKSQLQAMQTDAKVDLANGYAPDQAQGGVQGKDDATKAANAKLVEGALGSDLHKTLSGYAASAEDIANALARVESEMTRVGAAGAEIKAIKASVDPVTEALKEAEKATRGFDTAIGLLHKSGTREGLTGERNLVQKKLDQDTQVAGQLALSTDQSSLVQALTDPHTSDKARTLINDIIKQQERLAANTKSVGDLEHKAQKTKIDQLQEELDLRKALGTSSLQDELSTVNRQLKTAGDDNKLKIPLLSKKSTLNDQAAHDSYHEAIDADQEALDELKSSGTATADQLSAANKRVAVDLKDWENSHRNLLAQYKDLNQQAEKLEKTTKEQASHIAGMRLKENLTHLTEGFGTQDAAAGDTRARAAAVEDHIRDTRAAIAAGTITQAAGDKELVELAKQQAGFLREQAKAREAQLHQIDQLKAAELSRQIKDLQTTHAGGGGLDQLRKPGQIQELMAEETRVQLAEIERQYEADVKANKDKVLAAQEASLKKQALWQKETDVYRAQMDAQAAASKAHNASPLVGLGQGVTGSPVNFSGFSNFGEGFGTNQLRTGGASALDLFRGAQLPDSVGNVFKSQQGFERPQPAGNTTTVHATINVDGSSAGSSRLLSKAHDLAEEAIVNNDRETNFMMGADAPPF